LTAEDGEKGCEVAAAEQPDIILMDLEMPVVDERVHTSSSFFPLDTVRRS
jgi:CheY-like chemotaxis protein